MLVGDRTVVGGLVLGAGFWMLVKKGNRKQKIGNSNQRSKVRGQLIRHSRVDGDPIFYSNGWLKNKISQEALAQRGQKSVGSRIRAPCVRPKQKHSV